MNNMSKSSRQLVAMMIALAGMIGSPTLSVYSQSSANYDAPSNALFDAAGPDQTAEARATQLYSKLPLTFEANAGQTDSRVKFISRADGHTLFLTPTEAVLNLETTEQSVTSATKLRMKFIGANPAPSVVGQEEQNAKTSYLMGKDSRNWRTNVASFGRVLYRNVYRGIDLIYYGNQRQFEYDFIVAPRANPTTITLEFNGAERMRIDANGDLVLSTTAGEVRQKQPRIYQEFDGIRKEIAGRYEIKGRHRAGFRVGAYDVSKQLIIDPEIVYSTCFGGTKLAPESYKKDFISDVALDSSGNAYVTGAATSIDLPTTAGVFQTVNRTIGKHEYNNNQDAFVAKFDPAGKLIYSTYLGGSGLDQGLSIAIDGSGNAYIRGVTSSFDFPVTVGAYQQRCLGCFYNYPYERTDTFVAKLDSGGTKLFYATFLGFWTNTQGGIAQGGIAVDAEGNAVVVGHTWAPDFHVVNGFQTKPDSPTHILPDGTVINSVVDIFIAKLNGDGSRFLYSTYLGGDGLDFVKGVGLDSEGKIYVAGDTSSQNFPTVNGYQMESEMPPTATAMFLTKIDPEKSGAESLLYSTYIGSWNYCSGFTLDRQGCAYLIGGPAGQRLSEGSFPNTIRLRPQMRFTDQILIKIDTRYKGKMSAVFGVLFADSNCVSNTRATDVAVDASGNIYLAGYTQAYDFPEVNNMQVAGAFVTSTDGGKNFLSRSITTENSGQLTGLIQFVAADPQSPSTVYAVNGESGHLLYKSTDYGASWSDTRVASITNIPYVVAIDPKDTKILYVGMKNTSSLVYKSMDAGASWTPVGPPNSDYTEVRTMAIDPQNTSTIYIGCENRTGQSPGVVKTTDGGATWATIDNSLARVDINDLAINPENPSEIFAGTAEGLFKSLDGGKSWNSTSIKSCVTTLAIDPRTPSTVYAGLADNDIRIASIGGRGNPRRRIVINSLARFEGIVKSTDGGDHWNFTGSLYSMTKSVALSAQTKSEPPTLYIGTRITNKAFLMKLSPERTLLYSSALGGNGWYQNDAGFAVAADDNGNAYVVGETYSSNFPTKNALQTAEDLNDYLFALSGFLTKINTTSKPAPSPDPTPDPQPAPVVKITGVSVSGKTLFVVGENFSASATIMLNGADWPTINDSQNPTTALMSKKAGKKVKPGRSVTIQVKNTDGTMSESFQYVRPAN
ncbi:MAG TPA: SBBP repeat-containing protein [Blastocatellia bacterium]|nr:SBBP repeat-containing protein [Blastocatellia bacterium]